MKILRWLADHWYLPLFVLGVFLGWWLTRGRGKVLPTKQIQTELKAIEAGRKAKSLEAELGAEQATAKILKEYKAEVQKLNEEEAKQVAELKQDPVALSKFLVKTGSLR
jgi:hypothetical protein